MDKNLLSFLLLGIFFGIIVGMLLAYTLMQHSLEVLINNILPKITIENINFDLNETALVEAMNRTFTQETFE